MGKKAEGLCSGLFSLTVFTVHIWMWGTLAGSREGLHLWDGRVKQRRGQKKQRANSRDFFPLKSSSIYTVTLTLKKATKIGRNSIGI